MSPYVIDHSIYRVAEAICEQYRAGESAESIGDNYFATVKGDIIRAWLVELIVAASDPKALLGPDRNLEARVEEP